MRLPIFQRVKSIVDGLLRRQEVAGANPVTLTTEGVRIDEEAVLKTVAGKTVAGAIPVPSANL